MHTPTIQPPPRPPVDPDAALLTLAKLLTGAGGAISEADMRDVERFLDAQHARIG